MKGMLLAVSKQEIWKSTPQKGVMKNVGNGRKWRSLAQKEGPFRNLHTELVLFVQLLFIV